MTAVADHDIRTAPAPDLAPSLVTYLAKLVDPFDRDAPLRARLDADEDKAFAAVAADPNLLAIRVAVTTAPRRISEAFHAQRKAISADPTLNNTGRATATARADDTRRAALFTLATRLGELVNAFSAHFTGALTLFGDSVNPMYGPIREAVASGDPSLALMAFATLQDARDPRDHVFAGTLRGSLAKNAAAGDWSAEDRATAALRVQLAELPGERQHRIAAPIAAALRREVATALALSVNADDSMPSEWWGATCPILSAPDVAAMRALLDA